MGEAHIVQASKGLFIVRILQIVFALIVVGLTAFLISNTIGFVFSATAFGIFCGIITLIIVTYGLVAERAVKGAYNMWAILALDIVMVIFWLAAMGAMAALRGAFTIPVTIFKRELMKRYVYTWAGSTYLAILAAAAGVAAIEFILFIASLVMFSVALHRHRKSKGGNGDANGAAEKLEMQPGMNPYQAPASVPAPSYPNYQQPAAQPMPPQHTGSPAFSPVSPMQTGQPPYQPATSPAPQAYPIPTMSPPPQQYPNPSMSPPPQQYAQPAPQYPTMAPPQGFHEVPAPHQGHH